MVQHDSALLEPWPPGVIFACLSVAIPVVSGDRFATVNQTLELFVPLRPSDVPYANHLDSLQVVGQVVASGIGLLALIK